MNSGPLHYKCNALPLSYFGTQRSNIRFGRKYVYKLSITAGSRVVCRHTHSHTHTHTTLPRFFSPRRVRRRRDTNLSGSDQPTVILYAHNINCSYNSGTWPPQEANSSPKHTQRQKQKVVGTGTWALQWIEEPRLAARRNQLLAA